VFDSPSWIAAKSVGDSAEFAVAEWFTSKDFQAFKTLGRETFDLLLQATVEVKRDRLSKKTGNVAVEVQYNGVPSGIQVSPAAYWVFVLDDEALLINARYLRDLIASNNYPERPAGNEKRSIVKLIPVESLRRHPKIVKIALKPATKATPR
jgi:hypothetical protein